MGQEIECQVQVLEQLRRIRAPVVTGVPPCNVYRDMVRMPDGEIRHYGVDRTGGAARPVYMSSRDCGLSWQTYPASERAPGACVHSPWSGDWLTVLPVRSGRKHEWSTWADPELDDATYVFRSPTGPDGDFEVERISELPHGMTRLPLPLRHRKRWIVASSAPPETPGGGSRPVVLFSDNDGRTWERRALETVAPHVAKWPHRGVRWQNGAVEPTVVELSDGRLWMVMRTSQDNHYESFSEDGGDTWTTPVPSRFYGTLTMPLLHCLEDGRILFVWCNTTPLPEVDHNLLSELRDEERRGEWEDVFTNRDALHAAVSEDDGRTWIGFRELILDERRNDADFRTSGGSPVNDKSVHQCQALELPEGRVLVSLGQHPRCRRFLIFALEWLYETERSDDFLEGWGNWSVHTYVRSVSGIRLGGKSGHCAHNRRPGPQLVPDPDGERREVLRIGRHPDPRLLHEAEGATWNFAASLAGALTMRLRMPRGSQGARICLLDRWFNPVDPVVSHFAQYALEIGDAGDINGGPVLKQDVWEDLHIRWSDAGRDAADFRLGGSGAWTKIDLNRPSRDGISYVHIQSTAARADPHGLLLAELEARAE